MSAELLSNLDPLRIGINFSSRTGRSVDHYLDFFYYGANGERLLRKRILDIGSGDAPFATYARRYDLGQIIRLDPTFLRELPQDKKDTIVGVAQTLPFADKSFDEVIVAYSLVWVISGLEKALTEMIRVTRKGGVIKIHPAIPRTAEDNNVRIPDLPPMCRLALVPCGRLDGNFTLEITKQPKVTEGEWLDLIGEINSVFDFSRILKPVHNELSLRKIIADKYIPRYIH